MTCDCPNHGESARRDIRHALNLIIILGHVVGARLANNDEKGLILKNE